MNHKGIILEADTEKENESGKSNTFSDSLTSDTKSLPTLFWETNLTHGTFIDQAYTKQLENITENNIIFTPLLWQNIYSETEGGRGYVVSWLVTTKTEENM